MQRVLFLNHTAQLGGGELSLLDLARHTPGCRVLLLAGGPFRERLEEAGVEVQVVAAPAAVLNVRRESRLGALGALPGLLRLGARVAAIARDFDIIHCNSQKAFVVGSLAGLRSGRPVIWHLRDMLTHSSFSGLNKWLTVQLANRVARQVITNSFATAAAFVTVGGNKRKTAVLHNGIRPTADALPVLQLNGRRPVLGSFSRLSPWKGQHVLLEAAARLRPAFPNLVVLLVGSPLFGEDAYAEGLRKQATDLGLEQHVRFLGFRSDVAGLMAQCDVVVHTSVEPEPFGRVIVEGQLAGKPVVATAAGGAVELINHGQTGLLVSPGDALALAEAVQSLMTDEELRRRIAQHGHDHAVEAFSVEQMVARFHQLLKGGTA